ncbi:hypothetical protein CDCA_CDCA16G4189 [Cyanidium caldarium]|uniref:WD40 repeat-containing protein SMU1 n=1 Tax=Cyanidium caldarium TaxID=2771 RepID=A0AAV9J0U6_CYACA|nr:hypothetical protein CDCA_CDCA16G4189 [Cyanidium caldarium]
MNGATGAHASSLASTVGSDGSRTAGDVNEWAREERADGAAGVESAEERPAVLDLAAQAVLIDRPRRYTRGLALTLERLGGNFVDLAGALPSSSRASSVSALLPPTSVGAARDVGALLARRSVAADVNGVGGAAAAASATDGGSDRDASMPGDRVRTAPVPGTTVPAADTAAPPGGIWHGLVFDPDDPQVQRDIMRMIAQYLDDHGYSATSMVLQDEAQVHERQAAAQRSQVKRMRGAVLGGDWAEVERLCQKGTLKNWKLFLYAVYRQQFLELVDRHEHDKAYALLTKRLKPLEGYAPRGSGEFRELCYLLTCKSVQEVHAAAPWGAFEWNGAQAGREALVEQFARLLELEQPLLHADAVGAASAAPPPVPPRRLERLLQQAFAYQVEYSRYHPQVPPRIRTLLEDYHCFVMPNAERQPRLRAHEGNVKCVEFVGTEGMLLATGSSDNRVGVWDTDSGTLLYMLRGHTSRVWDVSSSPSGRLLASGSADGTVRLWNPEASASAPQLLGVLRHQAGAAATTANVDWESSSWASATLSTSRSPMTPGGADAAAPTAAMPPPSTSLPSIVGSGDVYTVRVHPGETHLVSGGYDKALRLHDVRTGQVVKTFTGHQGAVSRAVFNPFGNLIVSGSKDATIKFWDVVSGVCVKTFSFHFGEVTSVEVNATGTLLLSSSKDNSNRLWDVRSGRAVRRFKGHQNTSKNFIRAAFGPNELLVLGGSEDGYLYIWDVESSRLVQRLRACERGAVFSAVWCRQQGLVASGGNDGDARLWWYDPSRPLVSADTE